MPVAYGCARHSHVPLVLLIAQLRIGSLRCDLGIVIAVDVAVDVAIVISGAVVAGGSGGELCESRQRGHVGGPPQRRHAASEDVREGEGLPKRVGLHIGRATRAGAEPSDAVGTHRSSGCRAERTGGCGGQVGR